MKIALAQLNFHIGNFEMNTSRIIESVLYAKKHGADLVVFAELAVCGYPPRDFLEYDYFINHCEESILKIAEASKDIGVIIGAPVRNKLGRGKPLFNSALLLENGKIADVRHKVFLPTYDVFDENRYFEKGTELALVKFRGMKFALTICEDLWNIGEKPLYNAPGMDELAKHKPEFIINIAASPYSKIHAAQRKDVFLRNTERYNIPLFFVNQVGSQTELIFDGGSMVLDRHSKLVRELSYFSEDMQIFEVERSGAFSEVKFLGKASAEKTLEDPMASVSNAIVLGVRDYFEKLGFKKAIVGLSGGIDSAVTLVLATRALGKENVCAVLLPSPFSSAHSVSDADELVKNLGVQRILLPIGEIYDSFTFTLSPEFKDLPFGLAEENLQARIRGTLLMALSNKFGYILLNTSNKSELAVGYGTLYGDMCGGLSVIGDLYKTEVYELAEYLNKEQQIIPLNTLKKEPSAELRPDQKDSDSLPPYSELDRILFKYIEEKSIDTNAGKDVSRKVLAMVNNSEYKRYQSPPILRLSEKSFGMGRRMPIVAKYVAG